MLIYSFGELRGYQSSSGWLTAQGEVISSKVIERDAGRSGTRYRPEIIYAYVVDDNRYTSSRIIFGSPGSSRSSAQSRTDQYSVGRAVDVLYNPDDPADAVLERQLDRGVIPLLAIGVVLSLVGVSIGIREAQDTASYIQFVKALLRG
jgi:hypothetical protein